ncbi:hypothetical protein N7449_003537 [Penicillium cf. viridicatum]|uniref:Uncharacterized protein n=1 Tax=Penicillium cf. viridicatum TaxID=2972119 RepID=A0A9W9MX47_9EURO|nr:hypothetical protein N7449_003537 [Penicillium cf. viridicatum]
MGHPVVVWAHGIPFIPVYADYYAAVGSRLRKYLWLLTTKASHAKLKHEGWHLGEVVVSPKKLPSPTDTTFNVDFDTYDWSKFSPVPTFKCSTIRHILLFHGPSLTITRPTNIHGFHPSAGASRDDIANRPNDVDNTTWSNWTDAPYQNERTAPVESIQLQATNNPTATDQNTGANNPTIEQDTTDVAVNTTHHHPTSHLAVNTRESPSESPSVNGKDASSQGRSTPHAGLTLKRMVHRNRTETTVTATTPSVTHQAMTHLMESRASNTTETFPAFSPTTRLHDT